MLKHSSYKLLNRLLIVGIILVYSFFAYRYYVAYLNFNYFVTITISVLLSVLALTLVERPYRYDEEIVPRVSLSGIRYIVIVYVFFFCMLLEVWFYGHLGIFSIIMLIVVFALLLFSHSHLYVALTAVLSSAILISVLYGIYSPSFGNDTWRDAVQATQIIERGGLKDLTMAYEAYPLPVVSLLYAIHSISTGLDTLWSSSIMGLVYLLLLSLLVYLVARRFNMEYSHMAVILALITPLIVIWSVWFIPQTYSLLMAIPLLFLDLHPVITLAFAIATVLGHGGLSLWALAILTLLVLVKKVIRVKEPILGSIEIKLITIMVIFMLYTTYTTFLMVLEGAVSSVIEALFAFLGGERIIAASTPIQFQYTVATVLGVIPVIVLVGLGLVVLIESKDTVARLLALASLAGLSLAYAGSVANPALDLPRYLGLGSMVVLTILSPQAIKALLKRGRAGAYYALLLVLLAIVSFGFTGALMPGNPYTANSQTVWSLSGLLTYSETRELEKLAPLFCCNNYLVDWRAGVYVGYEYLWVQARYRGFYNLETQSSFTLAGSYGLLVTIEYFDHFTGVLIFRKTSLNMREAYSPNIHLFLDSMISKVSVLYTSPQIKLISFDLPRVY